MDRKLIWSQEGSDQGYDTETGAHINRLTSASSPSHLIYCEMPYTSPDGRYSMLLRCSDFSFSKAAIVIGNLRTKKHRTLLSDCRAYGIYGSSYSEPVPYITADNRYVIYNASPFGVNQVFSAEIPERFLEGLN